MRKILLLTSLLLTTGALASPFTSFIHGLKRDLLFTGGQRGLELGREVRVTRFGVIGRWASPDATATYNDKLNVISLDKELLEDNFGQVIVKDARQIRGPDYRTYVLSTIFHEMGHAELDVFIENNTTFEDQSLNYYYKNTLKSFYQKNFPRMNPLHVFHEHFAYYRSDLIDLMYDQLDQIFMSNGFNKHKNSCFLNPALRKMLADGVRIEDFTHFFDVFNDSQVSYRKKLNTHYVYVRGKELNLLARPANQAQVDMTHTLFWSYHQTFYNFPMNRADFIKRLNQNSDAARHLRKCRTELWLKHFGRI